LELLLEHVFVAIAATVLVMTRNVINQMKNARWNNPVAVLKMVLVITIEATRKNVAWRN